MTGKSVAHTESGRKPWFRFYTEALDDLKVQKLPPHLFKTWVNLLCLAGQNGGRIPSVDEMAFRLRMSAHDAEQQLSDLILAGLIDITDRGHYPHNWHSRQYVSDSSAERTRKYRERKQKQSCDADVTSHVTVPEQKQSRTESETDLAKAVQKFDLRNFVGVSRGVSPRLKAKAEGLGLPVAEMASRAMAPDVKQPNAMFRHLAVERLSRLLPNAPPAMLKAALTKDGDAAFGSVCGMLLEVTP